MVLLIYCLKKLSVLSLKLTVLSQKLTDLGLFYALVYSTQVFMNTHSVFLYIDDKGDNVVLCIFHIHPQLEGVLLILGLAFLRIGDGELKNS